MFFKNELKKRIKNEKGLTLIELLAVIVILAIIAAIAIPAIGNIIANSRAKAVISDAQNAMSAANIYFTDEPNATNFNNVATTDTPPVAAMSADDFKAYLDSSGKLKNVNVVKGSPNKINFTADLSGKTVTGTGLTMDDLNKLKVTKGAISLTGGSTGASISTQ
ncbi:MAG: prepilin-type N-terminal cleavage/methylation domain-containing protein [Lysinibacillus sp.]